MIGWHAHAQWSLRMRVPAEKLMLLYWQRVRLCAV